MKRRVVRAGGITLVVESNAHSLAASAHLRTDPGLSKLRRVCAAGNWAGLIDAILLCEEAGRPLPEWATMTIASLLKAELRRRRVNGSSSRTRGQESWFTKYRRDIRDYYRYDAVRDCREHRDVIKKSRGSGIFQEASLLLVDTPYWGSPKSIEDSCEKVRKNLKANPYRYYRSRYIDLFGLNPPTVSKGIGALLTEPSFNSRW